MTKRSIYNTNHHRLPKRIIRFMGLIACFFICLTPFLHGQSAGTKTTIEGLEGQFNQKQLSTYQLLIFSKRGEQKIKDFADYLNLYLNPNYDESLKAESLKLLLALFEKPKSSVPNLLVVKQTSISLEQLLETAKEAKLRFNVGIKNMETKSSFGKKNTGYQGILSFELTQTLPTGRITTRQLQTNITIKQVKRKFGEEELMVWKVFLGDITYRVP